MAVTMQYRITIKCDSCGEVFTSETINTPPMASVPLHWIQAQPPGSREQMEFCSVECLAAWKPAVKPWNE